jgi:hypothetical protein
MEERETGASGNEGACKWSTAREVRPAQGRARKWKEALHHRYQETGDVGTGASILKIVIGTLRIILKT